jgi:hypothetical protein
MRTQELRPNYRRVWISKGIRCLLVVVSLAASAAAQSTDRDNPTPLASNEVRGNGVGKKIEYYYTFLAGPGEVILTVDSGAKGSFSQLEAQIFNLDAEKLAQVQNLPYPGETSRKVTRVSFGAQQPVLLRVFVDHDAAQYLVRIGGAAQFAGADASFAGPPVTDANTSAAITEPVTSPPASTQPQPTDPHATPEAGTPTSGKSSSLKKLWLKLSSAGEVLGLAGAGTVRVEMKDGTTQEIGLARVKNLLVGEATQASADGSNVTASGEDKSTGWQRLWLKLGNAGELAGSSARPLRIEMKDGSIQEFAPSKVKRVSFKK